ncbi:MAG: HU family DNA-binding protein, partial [Muribaculaceae bacterium]|nr:HU family DNA-binding protein [Muribaculaceae bacterium]
IYSNTQKMDNRSFLNTVAKATGLDSKSAGRLVEKLSASIADSLAEENPVAIPGFGNFSPVTTDEHIETDTDSGKRRLVPPSVSVSFEPASRLKKAISNK